MIRLRASPPVLLFLSWAVQWPPPARSSEDGFLTSSAGGYTTDSGTKRSNLNC